MSTFTDKDPRDLQMRLWVITALAIFFFTVIMGRLWYLQLAKGEHFRNLSENNRIRLVKLSPPRGLIKDRKGKIIAENRPGFDLLFVPEDIADMDKTIIDVAKIIGKDKDYIQRKLNKARSRPPFQPVTIKEDLSWEETETIETFEYEMTGVKLQVSPKRDYPYGDNFAHLLGYIGEVNNRELKRLKDNGVTTYTQGDYIGKSAIEKYYEENLTGQKGGSYIEVDAVGRPLKTIKEISPIPGHTLNLAVDLTTQLKATELMKDKAGAVIAMDPRTGEILTLVSAPAFNPNLFTTGISETNWRIIIDNPHKPLNNKAVQGLYPPASTFKVVPAIAALEENIITKEEKIMSGSSYKYGNQVYRDWKASGHGKINVERAIIQSSDTFFYQVGVKLGIDTLSSYGKWFGFGETTGIDTTGEKSGIMPSRQWKKDFIGQTWYNGETINTVIGQGYTLSTPLQVLNLFSTIANGGSLMTPQITKSIETIDGEVIREFEPKEKHFVTISDETLSLVQNALLGVVEDDKGTAKWLRTKGIKIAGKTGTAQVIRLHKRSKDVESQPYKFRDHAWFAGFAPFDDPKIAVVVLVEHGGFGSVAAAPIAREIIKTYLGTLEKDTAKDNNKTALENKTTIDNDKTKTKEL